MEKKATLPAPKGRLKTTERPMKKTGVSPSAKRFGLSAQSPFALAFGKVESDSDEDDFGDFDKQKDSSAEQCWDEMMNEFEEPKKKGIKLR